MSTPQHTPGEHHKLWSDKDGAIYDGPNPHDMIGAFHDPVIAARFVACFEAIRGIPNPAAFVEAATELACAVERSGEIDPVLVEPIQKFRAAIGMHTDPDQCHAECCGCIGVSIEEFQKHRKEKK